MESINHSINQFWFVNFHDLHHNNQTLQQGLCVSMKQHARKSFRYRLSMFPIIKYLSRNS
uniref:Uncharacterized protein n=1 Tax=Rhizophora mucronata TaxID=61149 RepID=A0A2P2JGK2_RHIMU